MLTYPTVAREPPLMRGKIEPHGYLRTILLLWVSGLSFGPHQNLSIAFETCGEPGWFSLLRLMLIQRLSGRTTSPVLDDIENLDDLGAAEEVIAYQSNIHLQAYSLKSPAVSKHGRQRMSADAIRVPEDGDTE